MRKYSVGYLRILARTVVVMARVCESENGAGAVASNIGSINIEIPLNLNYSAWLCNEEARRNGRINVMSSIL